MNDEILMKNLKIMNDCYIDLYFFETGLKTRVIQILSNLYGDNWIEKAPFHTYAKDKIIEAETLIKKENKNKPLEFYLMLGFWTGIFHKFYYDSIWKNNIEKMFPNLLSKQRNLSIIAKELDQIRLFRNSLFHFDILPNEKSSIVKNLIIKYKNGL